MCKWDDGDADMAMTGLREILQIVCDSQISPRSLNQVKLQGISLSWFIKSDPAVFKAAESEGVADVTP